MKRTTRLCIFGLTAFALLVGSACAATDPDATSAEFVDQTMNPQIDGAVSSTTLVAPSTTLVPQGSIPSSTAQVPETSNTQTTTGQVTTSTTPVQAVVPAGFDQGVTIINNSSPNAGQTTLAQLIEGDKPVVLWSFAAWCPQCRAEAPAIDAFAAANPDIQVIGIGSLDTAEASVGFIQETGVQNSTMVWADQDGALWAQLGFSGRTERLVVSADLSQRQGPNGGAFDEARIRSQIASFG